MRNVVVRVSRKVIVQKQSTTFVTAFYVQLALSCSDARRYEIVIGTHFNICSQHSILRFKVLLLLCLWSCHWASAAKILAFLPMPWRSHQNIFRPLIRELATRGHRVDFYTWMPMPDPPKGLRQFKVSNWQDAAMAAIDEDLFIRGNVFDHQYMMFKCYWCVMENTFTHDKVAVDLLHSNETYDVVISEYMSVEATVYLAHKFKALNIAIAGYPDNPWINEVAGLPNNPAYMITPLNALTDQLDFWQRMYNLYVNLAVNIASGWITVTKHQALADEFIRYEGWETRPKIMDMISETALILTNSHVSTGFAFPKAPHMKEISGMHIAKPEQMPKDLQDFLDGATNGVIYFSLGSVLDPKEILVGGLFEIFVKVFRELKQKVIWKLPEGMPKLDDPKFFTGTWFPQQAILNHRNVKMFITHGGMQSTIEAIAYGVPCLGIPFYFDQKKDVALIEYIGMGLPLYFENVTETTLSWSINEILTNPKYREHAKKRQSLFHDRPLKPVDEAVYWIEYVLRHGKVLVPASAKLPFYQLYLLDVMAMIVLAVALMLYVLKIFLSTFFGLCWRSPIKSPTPRSKKRN